MLRRRIISYSLRKFPHCNVSTLHIKPEVKDAINNGKPVVALESTIISHGMRYPRNLEVALQAEEIIRNCGAIPATCAVIGGFAKVGLEQSDLQLLATQNENNDSKLHKILKVSRKDLAYVCATGKNGATTVSGTMLLAHLSGIKIFATGGIGGVHRGAETTMDISADLQELSKIPVGVVCAGIKSILDIPKTLEYLETLGVPVIGYQCEQFPAFFTKDSGCKSPINANNAMEIARILSVSESLGLPTGAVIAVPPPISTDSSEVIRSTKIQEAIEKAIELSSALNIKGSAITPFLLSEVDKYTKGASLDVNVSLMLNNAKIAAEIAIAYNQINYRKPATVYYSLPATLTNSNLSTRPNNKHISSEDSNLSDLREAKSATPLLTSIHATSKNAPSIIGLNVDLPLNPLPDSTTTTTTTTTALPPQVIVIGGAVVDYIVKSEANIDISLVTGSSAPGRLKSGYGGVARNIADSLRTVSKDWNVSLLSIVGQDNVGEAILDDAAKKGIDITSTIVVVDNNKSKVNQTATYTAVHNKDGDLLVAIADMEIMNKVTPSIVIERLQQLILRIIESASNQQKQQQQQQQPLVPLYWPLIAIDANFSDNVFKHVVNYCSLYQLTILFEPTSTFKAVIPVHRNCLHQLDVVTPNIVELLAMLHACVKNNLSLTTNILKILKRYPPNVPPLNITINEIAVLAVALLRLMLTNNNNYYMRSDHSEGADSSTSNKDDTRLSELYSEASETFHNYNNIIKQRKIGKHVFVTMGKHGVLWAHQGSSSTNHHHPFSSNSSTKYKTIIVDDDISWMHLPAIVIDPKTHQIGSTNGAGDAFVAGLISELLRQELSTSTSSMTCNYIQCVENGLKAAHSHLLKDSAKSDGSNS